MARLVAIPATRRGPHHLRLNNHAAQRLVPNSLLRGRVVLYLAYSLLSSVAETNPRQGGPSRVRRSLSKWRKKSWLGGYFAPPGSFSSSELLEGCHEVFESNLSDHSLYLMATSWRSSPLHIALLSCSIGCPRQFFYYHGLYGGWGAPRGCASR